MKALFFCQILPFTGEVCDTINFSWKVNTCLYCYKRKFHTRLSWVQKVDTKTKFANLIDVENLELAEDNKNGTSKLVV